jgi:monoamine oxidase
MNRRQFIRRSSLSLAGIYFLPSLLTSCKKEEYLEDSTFEGSVAIIGAGAAGLYAAHLLSKRGIPVKVFEASDRIGGRIKPLTGFASFPIELGAEEIHGDNSVLYSLLANSDAQFVNWPGKEYYELDGLLVSETAIANDPDYLTTETTFNELAQFTGGDTSASTYGTLQGITNRTAHIWNGWVGAEMGTSNDRLSIAGAAFQTANWSAGDPDFILTNHDILSTLLDQMPGVSVLVQKNTPIVKINYQSNKVLLTDDQLNEYEADRVIVTAPIPVLFSDAMEFQPALPSLHRQAINSIGMGRGYKLILKFNAPFWPADMGSLYTAGLVPLYWPTASQRSGSDFLLTAFIMGAQADQFATLHANGEAISTILGELGALFGSQVGPSFVDFHLMDWASEPWIGGAYSFPQPGTGEVRGLLAEPVEGKLFFAGEATHTGGHFGTVHGAMESGARAVAQVLKS